MLIAGGKPKGIGGVGMLRLREKDRFARLLPSLCMTMLRTSQIFTIDTSLQSISLQSAIRESTISSVPEVADAGEEHGQSKTVGGADYFGVALRASGLDDGGGSGLGDFFDAVGKRKEGIGGGDCAVQQELSLHGADLGRIYSAHLSAADADGLAVAGVDDGVRFYVLADFPGEEQGAGLFGSGSAFGDHLEIGVLQGADVGVLHEHAAGDIL